MDLQQITGELQTLQQDIPFPITKEELITLAESKGVSDELKSHLQGLPEQSFGSVDEIMQKLPLGNIGSEVERELGKIL